MLAKCQPCTTALTAEVSLSDAWPAQRPHVPPQRQRWFSAVNADFLSLFVGPGAVVVEIGAWMGESALWFADTVGATGHVYTIDHFKGSREHRADPKLAEKLSTLWETFVVNCWDSRERITPVRFDSRAGLLTLYQHGVRPAVIYVDGAHDYETVMRDVLLSAFLWPAAQITGDDFDWPDVHRAALDAGRVLGRAVQEHERCFALRRVEEKHPKQPCVG